MPTERAPAGLPPGAELASARSGAPSLRAGGRWLHSRYDPAAEAARLVAGVRVRGRAPRAAVLFGTGLGHEAAAALAAWPGPLLAVEREPAFTAAGRAAGILPADPRLTLVHASAEEAFLPFFRGLSIEEIQGLALLDAPGPVAHDPAFYRAARAGARAALVRACGDLFTELEFERLWQRNILDNAAAFAAGGAFLPLVRSLAGVPCLLVGAGPTLAGALPFLRAARERAALVAVDTALATLADGGVAPDIVVALDAQRRNLEDFHGAPLGAALVLADLSAHPGIARLAGPAARFFETAALAEEDGRVVVRSHPTALWVKQVLGEAGPARSGGNVATSALELVRLLGCDPVFFVGLDHAYPGRVSHARGAPAQRRLAETQTRVRTPEGAARLALAHRRLVMGRDNAGRPCLTDPVLARYAAWIAEAKVEAGEAGRWFATAPAALAIDGVPFLDEAAAAARLAAHPPLARPLAWPAAAPAADAVRDLARRADALRAETAAERARLAAAAGTAAGDDDVSAGLAAFFTRHPYLRPGFGAALLHAATRRDDPAYVRAWLTAECGRRLARLERTLARLLRRLGKISS